MFDFIKLFTYCLLYFFYRYNNSKKTYQNSFKIYKYLFIINKWDYKRNHEFSRRLQV